MRRQPSFVKTLLYDHKSVCVGNILRESFRLVNAKTIVFVCQVHDQIRNSGSWLDFNMELLARATYQPAELFLAMNSRRAGQIVG